MNGRTILWVSDGGARPDWLGWEREFWALVDRRPGGCWPWRGRHNDRGYGSFRVRRVRGASRIGAHRLAWELTNGPSDSRLDMLHSCDNPPCCNPDHLSQGTRSENMLDASRKGRTTQGERNRHAKLTDTEVRLIRLMAEGGWPSKRLAVEFAVTPSNVRYIVAGRTWGHLL